MNEKELFDLDLLQTYYIYYILQYSAPQVLI